MAISREIIERLRAQHTAPTTKRQTVRPTAPQTAGTAETMTHFEKCKRDFETAYNSGNDYGTALYDLSVSLARSVIRRLIDPQKTAARKAAANGTEKMDADGVALSSNSGCNPVMLALYRALRDDSVIVSGTEYTGKNAYHVKYDREGNPTRETADRSAADAENELSDRTFSDAHDIVQEIAVTLLDMAHKHGTGGKWLDDSFVHEVLAKRVYRDREKTVIRTEETTPIRQACRAGRRLIDDARALSLDAVASVCYDSEDVEIDGETETIYRRVNGYEFEMFAYETDFGCGADAQTVDTVRIIIDRIGIRPTERRILEMLMTGKSVDDIADALGCTVQNVYKHRNAMQKRMIECGYIPQGYRDAETVSADNAPHPVVCRTADGAEIVFPSAKKAAAVLNINAGSIRAAASGKRDTAGGYLWRFVE